MFCLQNDVINVLSHCTDCPAQPTEQDQLLFKSISITKITARCYASAVLAMGLCPSMSVSVCVCLSQAGVLLKRQNVGSQKQNHTIPQGLLFSDAKGLREIRPGSPSTGAPNAGGVGQNRRLSTNNRLYLENGKR